MLRSQLPPHHHLGCRPKPRAMCHPASQQCALVLLTEVIQSTSEVKTRKKLLVPQSYLTLCDPVDCSPLGSSLMGFSRQEYWSGLSFPSPGDLPDPGIKPRSPTMQADSLPSEPPGKAQSKPVRRMTVVGEYIPLSTLSLKGPQGSLQGVTFAGTSPALTATPLDVLEGFRLEPIW